MPAPVTAAVPMVVPPFEQSVGAFACGPYTVKVIVPPASIVAPESIELIELEEMAVPVSPDEGPVAVSVVRLLTVVDGIPVPQVLVDARLLLSPP